MNDIRLDSSRRERLGFDEAIFCAGKSVAQIEAILAQSAGNGGRFLLTRLAPEKFDALPAALREV
jgi:pyridinium-3,5-biscarboxylic acid mononucleotide synthase